MINFTRRGAFGASLAALALAACSRSRSSSENLNQILDRVGVDLLKEAPEACTSLGLTEQQAGGPYLDRLSDYSRAGLQRSAAVVTNALSELRALDRSGLSPADQVTYDVVTTAFENQLDTLRFEYGGGATQPYVVSQLNGAYSQIPDFLDSQHPMTSKLELDAYLSRLSAYAVVLDQETQRISEDAAAGIVPPDFAIDGAVALLSNFSSLQPNATVFVNSIARRAPEIEGLPQADRDAALARCEAIVRDNVLPAYRRQIAALQAIRARATHDAGCWRLPDGEAAYASALKYQTTTSMSPDEIHEMGVELVTQYASEMDALLRREGLTRGTVAERVDVIARRPDQLYPNNDAGRDQLLADLNGIARSMTARMPEVFGVQARAPLEIKRVPAYIEAGASGGYYQSAAIDGSRPGAYYINLRDLRELPKFGLPTLTYHEGVPGHHWQISIMQEAEALPFIRNALLYFNSYVEGWALYSEYLADELGAYRDNPIDRLGFLQSAAFRASRLVVDTGMHHKRWTREQAVESMMAATGDKRSAVITEIERYAVTPGQACGYMVGRQAILRMREEARRRTGAAFDFKGFHDLVLTNGATPLSVLERLITAWSPAP